MSELQIDKFQFKTIESSKDWDDRKDGEPPAIGEPVFIAANIIDGINIPIFLIGDGNSTLQALIKNNKYFVYKQTIPQSGNVYTQVTTNGVSSFGEALTWARSDHKHTLDRKISYGTEDVNTISGAEGDIYIKY